MQKEEQLRLVKGNCAALQKAVERMQVEGDLAEARRPRTCKQSAVSSGAQLAPSQRAARAITRAQLAS